MIQLVQRHIGCGQSVNVAHIKGLNQSPSPLRSLACVNAAYAALGIMEDLYKEGQMQRLSFVEVNILVLATTVVQLDSIKHPTIAAAASIGIAADILRHSAHLDKAALDGLAFIEGCLGTTNEILQALNMKAGNELTDEYSSTESGASTCTRSAMAVSEGI